MRIIILLAVCVLLTGARKLERQADGDENEEVGVVTIPRSSATVSSPRSNVVRREAKEEQERGDVDTEYDASYADDAAYTYSYSYSYGNSSYYGYGYGYGDDDGGDDDAANGDDGNTPVSDDDATHVVVIFDRAQPRPMFSFTPLFTGMGSSPLRSSRAQERVVDVKEEEEEEAVSSSSSKGFRTATAPSGLQTKNQVDVSQFLRGRQSATSPPKNADRQEPAQESWLPSAFKSALQRFAPK